MAYYGLSLNSGDLAGDFHLNFLLVGLVEFPAYTVSLFFLDRTGRKKLYTTCMVLGGVACVCTTFTFIYLDKSKCTGGVLAKYMLNCKQIMRYGVM